MKSENMEIIISSPDESDVRKVLKDLRNREFQWIYLGENVSKAINIERQIENKGRRFEIAEDLQKTAKSLRQPYIDYIGKLNIKNNYPWWWAGRISEKNPFVSKAFLYACYVGVFKTLIKSKDAKNCFVFLVENEALRNCLLSNSLDSLYKIKRIEPLFHGLLQNLKDLYKVILGKGLFVITHFRLILLSRYKYKLNQLPNLKPSKDTVLIQTWLTKNSFKEDSKYHDIYFGVLPQYLKSNGKNVVVVPFPPPDKETLEKIMGSGEQFLIPEAFLNPSDVIRMVIKTLLYLPRKNKYPLLEEMDISEILYDEHKKDWMETSRDKFLLLYEVVKHMAKMGVPIDIFICPYENLRHEKIFYMALKKFYPSVYIIGYQHATVPSMILNYFISNDEVDVIPSPDGIITNGKLPKRILSDSGYNPKKLVCGGAIRYAYLFKKKNTKIKTTYPQILVAPSIGLNEAAELIWKVLRSFEKENNYRVILKCHPFTPYHTIAKYLDVKSLPEHFVVSEKPISELLAESDILLYNSSTVAIEALASGVPVLHITSEFTIDMDPLDVRSEIRHSARSTADIKKNVNEILSNTLDKEKKIWKNVVLDFFEPINEDTFNLFLRR